MTDYINIRLDANSPLTQLGEALKAAGYELKCDETGLRIDRRGRRKAVDRHGGIPPGARFGPPEEDVND